MLINVEILADIKKRGWGGVKEAESGAALGNEWGGCIQIRTARKEKSFGIIKRPTAPKQ